jgi:hypothetical protein
MGVYPRVQVIEGGACRGCLSALRHSLDRLAFEGLLDRLPEITVYLGVPLPNRETLSDWRGDLWLFGNCASDVLFYPVEQRQQPHFLQGCPPFVLDFYHRLRRHYFPEEPESASIPEG